MTKNKTTIHLQSLLALPLMATLIVLLAACSSEETVTAGGDDNGNNGSVQIQFTLAVENGKQTRATTWGDDYDKEAANTWESMIDGGLQVYLFDTWSGNSYGGTVKAMKAETFVVSSTSGSNGYEYSVLGTFPLKKDEINTAYPYRLIVLANAPDCETSNITDAWSQPWNTQTFQAKTITYNTEKNEIDGGYIPMWGTQKYANIWETGTHLELKENACTDAGTIYLLRAMAKIVVKLDVPTTTTGEAQYTLTGVTLDRYNEEGNVAPTNAGNVDKTTDVEIEGGINPVTVTDTETGKKKDNITEEDLPFIKQGDNEYAVYIPEISAEAAKTVNVKLKVSNGSVERDKSFTLDSYENGQPSGSGINIVRNTIYEYTVAIGQSDITVNLKQMPWNIYSSSVSYSYKKAHLFAWNGWSNKENDDDAQALRDQYEEKSNPTTDEKYASVFYNGYIGDMEAVHSFVCYPCPAIDEDKQNVEEVYPDKVKNESSTADFYFTIEPGEGASDGQVMWRASLTNEEYFEFATNKQWNDGTRDRYCAASGVARKGQPFKISVRAKKPWQNLNGKSEDNFSNSSSWGTYAWSEEWERNNPPSTQLSIEVSQDGETWEPLAINGVNTGMVGSHHSSGTITSNDGKPYEGWRRFGGGEFYVRIFQFKAEGDSNGKWIGWHATALKNKSNDTEYTDHKSNDESEGDGTEQTIAP